MNEKVNKSRLKGLQLYSGCCSQLKIKKTRETGAKIMKGCDIKCAMCDVHFSIG